MLGVRILAVGTDRAGPVRDLVDDYRRRFDRVGRGVGLGPLTVEEVEGKGGTPAAEAAALRGALPRGALAVALDERGEALSSTELAARLDRWKGEWRQACFLIGGADGLDPGLVAEAGMRLSLGRMVWPHLMVRAMLAEQLYRAATILAGTPYHRA